MEAVSKRGRKVDETRDLCPICKLKDSCISDNFESGKEGNVYKCENFKKELINRKRWRASVGEEYFIVKLKDEKKSMKDFVSSCRIEKGTRFDNLYHEIGNYFQTLDECEVEIVRLNSLKK